MEDVTYDKPLYLNKEQVREENGPSGGLCVLGQNGLLQFSLQPQRANISHRDVQEV